MKQYDSVVIVIVRADLSVDGTMCSAMLAARMRERKSVEIVGVTIK